MGAYSTATCVLAGRKIPQGTLTPIGALLFSASEPGAWYDPSDMSTLFQDAAGTTPVTAVAQPVGRILDKSGRGNHATQATTTKRPVLSRRVNLLTKTEGLAGSAYVKNNCTVINDSGQIYPGAAKITANATDAATSLVTGFLQGYQVVSGKFKADGVRYLCMALNAYAVYSTTFDLVAGVVTQNSTGYAGSSSTIESLGDGWYRCIWSFAGAVSNARVWFVLSSNPTGNHTGTTFLGDGVSGILMAHPSITAATDAHLPYQQINTATDYDADPAKFPAHLRFDGVDDSYASATGGGGTAGFFFSSAVLPQGGAGTARTLFSDAGTNTGYIVRLNTSNQLELAAGNGTAYTTVATFGTLAVGTAAIVQAWDDGTNLNVKIGNGATASVARPVVSAGTAGYTMGQDNGASTRYFNGRLYSTIYRKDSGLTQVQREAVALVQRQKARMP